MKKENDYEDEREYLFVEKLQSIKDPLIVELLGLFMYSHRPGLDDIVRVLIWKLSVEKTLIDIIVLKWMLSQAMTDDEVFGQSDYIIMFGCYPQQHWTSVFVTLQLRHVIQLSVAQRIHIQSYLSEVDDAAMLRLLSLKLYKMKSTSNSDICDLDDIKAIFTNSRKLHIDQDIEGQLLDFGLRDWPLRLMWFDTVLQISLLNVEPALNQNDIEELSYYTAEVRQKFGDDICSRLLTVFSQKTEIINKDQLNETLRKLYRNNWVLDESTLMTLAENESELWNIKMSGKTKCDKPRDIQQLIYLMKQNSSNSDTIQDMLTPRCEEMEAEVQKTRQFESVFAQLSEKRICTFTEEDISQWSSCFRSIGEAPTMAEIICVIDCAIKLCFKINLRSTQILSIVIFLQANKIGVLEQISTGEGKSLIIVTLAIYKSLVERQMVDIITSSPVLAERDAKENEKLYGLFNIVVAHNNVDAIHKRKEVYTNSHVIYGDIGCFQRDLLLDTFYNDGNGIASREIGYVIVDEVDSMLIDKGSSVLYLSHQIAGMDALEPLYVFMWRIAHSKLDEDIAEYEKRIDGSDKEIAEYNKAVADYEEAAAEYDKITGGSGESMAGSSKDIAGYDKVIMDIMQATRQAMYPLLIKEELCKRLSCNEARCDKIWKELLRLKVINGNGRIDKTNIKKTNEFKLALAISEKGKLMSLLKDSVRREIFVNIPNCLESFVEQRLKDWAASAIQARLMNINEDYIIDIDRSNNAQRTDSNVVIMDNYTGAEQYSSQWSNGLHQFLQLKHSCRLSPESLKAVFISNVTFFKRYQSNLMGLSGTLGSQCERNFLKNLYGVEFCVIPTFKEPRFMELNPNIFKEQDGWLKKIASVCRIVSQTQVMLVICENIEQVKQIEEVLKKPEQSRMSPTAAEANDLEQVQKSPKSLAVCEMARSVHVYTRSYEPVIGGDHELNEPCVILSTNLAGRGTDIKIGESLNEKGGLHVILAYLPPNVRIEEQAFGRAARKGQNGSGQIICCIETENSGVGEGSFADFVRLKTTRNANEERKVNELRHSYVNCTEPEERLLDKFSAVYKKLDQYLSAQNDTLWNCFSNESNNRSNKIKELVLTNCLDNWALWLDNATMQGDLKSAPIDEFVKNMTDVLASENASLSENVDSLIDRPAHKITLSNLTKPNAFLKGLEQALQDNSDYKMIAHYYSAHLIINQEHPKTEKDSPECFKHLRAALRGFRKKQESFQDLTLIVAEIEKSYSHVSPNFVLVNNYEAQKRGIISILAVLEDSIVKIIGSELTIDIITSKDIDPVEAKLFLDELREKKLIEESRVTSEDWSELRDKYEIHVQEIEEFLQINQGKVFDMNMLRELLPSREHFWAEMLRCHLFRDNKRFVLLNKDVAKATLNEDYPELLDKIQKAFERESQQDLEDEREGKIWLYHEQLDQIKNGKLVPITRPEFAEMLGPLKNYKKLIEGNIFHRNCSAVISTQEVNFTKFGRVSRETFMHLDDKVDAGRIMKELIEAKIIDHEDSSSPQFVDFDKLVDYELKCYPEFQSEFESYVEKDLRYKTCLQALETVPEIQLPVKPWLELYDDMISYGCITPTTLKVDKASKKSIKKLAENKFTKKIATELVTRMEETLSSLMKFNRPTSNIQDLQKFFQQFSF